MSEAKHTKGKLYIYTTGAVILVKRDTEAMSSKNTIVAEFPHTANTKEEAKANADLFICACNSHHALLVALEKICKFKGGFPGGQVNIKLITNIADAAIAAATQEP